MNNQDYFCSLKDGSEVSFCRLVNSKGESAVVLNYGATVWSLNVRNKYGELIDVVLGAAPERLEECTYMGSVIGRVSNRIKNGFFSINGKRYELERNVKGHYLHGASDNWARKVFRIISKTENEVVLFHHDEGNCGFDCSCNVIVKYTFDENSTLTLSVLAEAEEDTLINPTSHIYFNLNGNGGENVLGHEVFINSTLAATRDEDMIPDGGLWNVYGTPAWFCRPRTIYSAMESDDGSYFKEERAGYDEFYDMRSCSEESPFASAFSPLTGIRLDVFSSSPALVFFTSGGRREETGKNGVEYKGFCGFCFEPSFMPNAVNCDGYDVPFFRRGEKFRQIIKYRFNR